MKSSTTSGRKGGSIQHRTWILNIPADISMELVTVTLSVSTNTIAHQFVNLSKAYSEKHFTVTVQKEYKDLSSSYSTPFTVEKVINALRK